jgi:ribulose-phosphate 3-epimerase
MLQIAPSILASDFSRLGEQIKSVEQAGASIIHVDVMDGHFVPNITLGIPVVRSLAKVTAVPLDCHLMITNPGTYCREFVEAGAGMVSVHVEADAHLHRTLSSIREAGGLAGIAINPATPLSQLEDVLEFADFILLMSVNPGFGGQKFIEASIQRVRRLREMIDCKGLSIPIEIDGGIDRSNISEIVSAGAEIIVAGSAIFGAPDPGQALRDLREAAVQWV